MPHHPSIDGAQYPYSYQSSVRFRQPEGPPKLQRDDGRSFFQSPPPAPTVSPVSDIETRAEPLPPPQNPRSARAREKQRAVSPDRNTTLSYEQAYGGMEIPIAIGGGIPPLPPLQPQYAHSVVVPREQQPSPVPQQDPRDPTRFKLPDIRNKAISAPLQPRVTDLRAHIERDPSYSTPAYEVSITFKIKMQPGNTI